MVEPREEAEERKGAVVAQMLEERIELFLQKKNRMEYLHRLHKKYIIWQNDYNEGRFFAELIKGIVITFTGVSMLKLYGVPDKVVFTLFLLSLTGFYFYAKFGKFYRKWKFLDEKIIYPSLKLNPVMAYIVERIMALDKTAKFDRLLMLNSSARLEKLMNELKTEMEFHRRYGGAWQETAP